MIGRVCFNYCVNRSWIRCIICVFWVIPAISPPMSMSIAYWAWGFCWFEILSITAISIIVIRVSVIVIVVLIAASFGWIWAVSFHMSHAITVEASENRIS